MLGIESFACEPPSKTSLVIRPNNDHYLRLTIVRCRSSSVVLCSVNDLRYRSLTKVPQPFDDQVQKQTDDLAKNFSSEAGDQPRSTKCCRGAEMTLITHFQS